MYKNQEPIEKLRASFLLEWVGKRIKELRKEQGMTQEELAHKIDSTPKTLSDIETGKSNMLLASLDKICRALNISLYDFFKNLEND